MDVAGRNNRIGGNYVGVTPAGTAVAANFVGTDVNNQALYGNIVDGIRVDGTQNVIGGPDATSANVVSGNDQRGIHVVGNGNQALRNLVGTDPSGVPVGPTSGPASRSTATATRSPATPQRSTTVPASRSSSGSTT